jgi:hypothetical protein
VTRSYLIVMIFAVSFTLLTIGYMDSAIAVHPPGRA